ncbi:hypothetical protein RCL1_002743 [Eukaryota sp. TZLM3-RCL]
MKSIVTDIRSCAHPHNEERIAWFLTTMIQDLGSTRVRSSTIDNGTNMITACRSLNVLREDQGLNKVYVLRFTGHIPNIAVQSGLEVISPVLQKVRELSENLSKSSFLTQELRDCFVEINTHSIGYDVKTRWSSTNVMLRGYLSKIDGINFFFASCYDESLVRLKLSGTELEQVKAIMNELKPFADTTNILSSCTIGTMVLLIADIERHIAAELKKYGNTSVPERKFINTFLKTVQTELKMYHDHLYSFNCYVAMFLDP